MSSATVLQDELVGLMADPVRRACVGDAARVLLEEEKGAQVKTLAAITELLPFDRSSVGHHSEKIRTVP